MRLYLDTCSLQRPLDSKAQCRIILEAEAVLGILALCDSGDVDLVSSEVLEFEVQRNPNATRRQYALEVLSKASKYVVLNQGIVRRAKELNAAGFKPLDSLHLASAEEAEADFLCTCDDGFLKRAKAIAGLRTRVASPLEVIREVERW
ncbi:MAG: type II toxin-antitoxin system VapC family toxin [Anaerolineae bacterium]